MSPYTTRRCCCSTHSSVIRDLRKSELGTLPVGPCGIHVFPMIFLNDGRFFFVAFLSGSSFFGSFVAVALPPTPNGVGAPILVDRSENDPAAPPALSGQHSPEAAHR
ncbi:unnamed protein product [Scytosiphon promiscuus]